MRINQNYQNLEESYLFSSIAQKVAAYRQANPEKKIISLGIGDVTLPLCSAVVKALHEAVEEMGKKESFHGYGPEQGYGFLRSAIRGYYRTHGVELQEEEIFVSDGAKSDLGNILELFSTENTVWIPDPVYPRLCGYQCDGGQAHPILKRQREKRFFAHARRRAKGRFGLPVLAQ